MNEDQRTPFIPLSLILNGRSLANKCDNLTEMMHQICPDLIIACETWERENLRLEQIIKSRKYKYFSYYRKNKSPGGGCAIIFNEERFRAEKPDVIVPENIEAVWSIISPVIGYLPDVKVKRIAVGSIYISPRSKFKIETIEHIIETIHILRAQYDNDVNFLICGDFNRVEISDILDCYGGLKQIISIPTRKTATLSIVLTDLHNFFHPATTLPPLQVDENKTGKDSDHDIVLLAPKNNAKYKVERTKRTIKSRPILESQLAKFEEDLARYEWNDVFENKSADEKAKIFHIFLRNKLDLYFPEKITKLSNLDRKWMSPALKQLHRRMQREFFRHRKSTKYLELKSKFKKMKKKAVRTFYSDFVSDLKLSDPAKWHQMAKKIGAADNMVDGDIAVESLEGLTNARCADIIAAHFAAISNQYKPIDYSQLPAYLPAQQPPQVDEFEVYLRLRKLRKSKSTLPIDVPVMVRQECSHFLAGPLTDIINTSLRQSQYPSVWKQEWVTPAPKISHPKVIKDLRKISCTSDYSKVFEEFLKDWVMEDIQKNIDPSQFGGQSGTGTEHMVVCLLDRILKLLDRNQDRSAVLMTCIDWASAFDRQDPTIAIQKFIKLGVRPSLIPLLASYLTDRKMRVKFNGELSEVFQLIGGGP